MNHHDWRLTISLYLDGLLSQDEVEALNEWVKTDPENARLFVHMSFIHSRTHDVLMQNDVQQFVTADIDGSSTLDFDGDTIYQLAQRQRELEARREAQQQAQSQHEMQERSVQGLTMFPVEPQSSAPLRYIIIPRSLFYLGIGVLAAMLVLLVSGYLGNDSSWHETPIGSPGEIVTAPARLTTQFNARWEGKTLRPGDELSPGWIHLVAGYAQLTFADGAVMVLEGPCRLRLDDAKHVRLETGAVTARISPQSKGFTVQTPHALIVDIGTEFAVAVDPAGNTEAYVFDGEVELHVDDTDQVPRRLTTDEHATIDTEGRVSVSVAPEAGERFRRNMDVIAHGPYATIANGLVAYYPLDGNAQDLASGYHGTPVNDVIFTDAGKVGGAAVFSRAEQQYIEVANANLFDLEYGSPPSLKDPGPRTYSYSVWFKVSGMAERYILATTLAGAKERQHEGFTLSARINRNGTLSVFAQFAVPEDWDGKGSVHYIGRQNLPLPDSDPEGWYHLVVTMETGVGLNVYVNGVELDGPYSSSGTGWGIDSTLVACDGLRIGGSQMLGNLRSFDGIIDEVAIWNRVLTEEERILLYNNGRGMPLPGVPRKAHESEVSASQP